MNIFWTPQVIKYTLIAALAISLIWHGLLFTDELLILIAGSFVLYKLIARE